MPQKPVDVLAQQIVAMVAAEDWSEDELYRTVCRAYPYRELCRQEFDEVVKMLAEGFSTRRGPRGAYVHRDGIHKRLRAKRGARLTAVTCGGAIPDNAEDRVILEPSGEFIGTVDEDFAIESLAGDIFQLGNASWRVLRLEAGTLRVEDARHQPPNIPFWFGEAPGRTHELSYAVSRLRREIEERLEENACNQNLNLSAALAFLEHEVGISPLAALQAVIISPRPSWPWARCPPWTPWCSSASSTIGRDQFIIHALRQPGQSRLGTRLRKRFCRTFNFELQAAATENAIILP